MHLGHVDRPEHLCGHQSNSVSSLEQDGPDPGPQDKAGLVCSVAAPRVQHPFPSNSANRGDRERAVCQAQFSEPPGLTPPTLTSALGGGRIVIPTLQTRNVRGCWRL